MTNLPLPKHDADDPWPATIDRSIDDRRAERARARTRERERERERARSANPTTRLSPSSLRLARWMRHHSIGAPEQLITRYGPAEILDILHDALLEYHTTHEWGSKRVTHWRIKANIRSPGGLLVTLLKQNHHGES